MTIHCPQCGENQPAPAQFCRRCGVQFIVQPQQIKPTKWLSALIAVPVLLFIAFLLSSGNKESTASNQTILNTTTKPQFVAEDLSKPLQGLSFKSTYFDVVKVLGKPDNEISAVPPEASIPNTMLFYKDRNWVVFTAYDMPYKGKLDKNKSHYLGTKSLNPEKVIHASGEKYGTVIDAYKFNK